LGKAEVEHFIVSVFRDAEVMRLKQQKAAEKKASGDGGAGTSKK
jgi:hypothetical protein